MANIFQSRIKRALTTLRNGAAPEAVVISSNPHQIRSRDTHFPYRPNSDLYYFTGITADHVTLVLRPHKEPHALLLCAPVDKTKMLWDGPGDPFRSQARAAGVAVQVTNTMRSSLLDALRGASGVYTQDIPGTLSFAVREETMVRRSSPVSALPTTCHELEPFVARLRLFKDKAEIAAIREAASLTGNVLCAVTASLQAGISERELGAFIDFQYRLNGGVPAFETIVASGPSAATLHHRTGRRVFREGEFVLIDTGAELNMYASDITRTLAVGEIKTKSLHVIHAAVCAAQLAAIKRIRHGVLIEEVYLAAAKELSRALRDLGVLKGSLDSIMKKKAFRPWFPHGIGHSLGLDVHDVGNLRNNTGARLEAGMVLTVEPGLYFPEKTRYVPQCGVRIEDDVLVTKKGAFILTGDAPAPELLEG